MPAFIKKRKKKNKRRFKSHGLEEYDVHKEFDPFAKQSSAMKRSRFQPLKQDGDVWLETIFQTKSGDPKTYFVSLKTGLRTKDEPPSGASTVVYLNSSAREVRMEIPQINCLVE
mmetsp:Transcript_20366/g.30592  ORF Transcript_20366/g.30592 Transcript_20366/m.30592 type:complete len:114 (-) Transcript_20366:20-361(-)|eukprot:CAMPEP_0203731646 /NCGR_PEP_ID=MMETSP0092-20131115/22988_1 /ASSEMBLY_ACC=CAM_ASM_001090 /TAXON_ID=426623 /ORGANISM="Chaetoceros affinis, Strain CCMP159" /LENGTH=113 /DNA_ID=CAMNT_0050614869 /DNA_START=101 /DNA_END=442 /DNA_ORIENTATION=-